MTTIYVYFEYTSCDYTCKPHAFRDYETACAWLEKCFEKAKKDAGQIDESDLVFFEGKRDDGLMAQANVVDDMDNWFGEVWKVELK